MAVEQDIEIWKPIPDCPGYEVSNLGRVKSTARTVIVRKTIPEKILKATPRTGSRVYQPAAVELYGRSRTVSRLVMLAFVGAAPAGMQVAHNDGNVTNNALINLRYDTPAGNSQDRFVHGTIAHGSRNGSAKLTEQAILEIRLSAQSGYKLARQYGVSQSTIGRIRRRQNWRRVE